MRKYIRQKMSLGLLLVTVVFGIMLLSVLIISACAFVLFHLGLLDWSLTPEHGVFRPLLALMLLLFISVLLGTVLTGLLSRKLLLPLRRVIAATHEVAAGNFEVEVELSGIGELDELANGFNKMTRELASTETLRSDFVNNFSHEFKTPIVSIRGFAKLLRDDDLDPADRAEYTDIIISESERLANLSTHVLNLSKLENRDIVTEKPPLELDEQIRRAAAMLEPKCVEKDIHLTVDLEAVRLNGNEELLQQIWVNLMDNAVKFTERGGNISIFLVKKNGRALFTIRDDGRGMDERTLTHLYDKFFQGDASRTGAGNGLGLSMVKRIVELCGGDIGVESAPGRGATFRVSLPLESV